MNPRTFLPVLAALIVVTPLAGQNDSDFNEGSRLTYDAATNLFELKWWARPEKLYFIHQTSDLDGWSYVPLAYVGTGGQASYCFQTNAAQLFLRLEVTDIAGMGIGTNSSDLDGDSIPNWMELTHGTNPFVADTDGDGVPDNLDPFPLDPSISGGPLLNVAGAPVITLIYPTGAVAQ